MKKGLLISSALLVLSLIIAACGAQGAAVVVQPTATAAQPPASTATLPSGTMVALSQNDTLGSFLVDDKGMTLYLFTKDTPNVTNCYEQCALNWPPLLTTGKPVAGDGVDAVMLGTTERTDGTMQVTYNGWPLYYYIKDMKAGDVVGQEVGDVWFVVTPAGEIGKAMASGTMVDLSQNDTLGSFLVDDKGMTLYLFTKDTPNVTNCYEQCALNWPPLLTTGAPVAGKGVDDSKLGTTERTDGTMQVTYNGWPLYYYIKDMKAGDIVGQEVGDVWFVVTPAGEIGKAMTSGTTVALSQNDMLGSFLVDDKGMTLYLFTKDSPNVSNCYDQCATNWPPLLTTGAPVAGEGVDDSKLGTTERTDGTMQVTYNGWPLYYYIKDMKAGDTVGQEVGDVWFVITPEGEIGKAMTGATTVALFQNDTLGSFLVDDKGMTLYLFTKDTPNTSTCYDQCATNWPPLLTTGAPVAGEGVDDSKLGTTERTDGTMQVTYNGWPLYFYIKDMKAGDTVGQKVGDVWFVVSPDGEQITAY